MKIKSMLTLFCCAAVGMTLLSGCGKAETEKNNENGGNKDMTHLTATKEYVKQIGRTYMIDDTLWMALSGTGIEFEYTGKNLTLELEGDGAAFPGIGDNQARYAVFVDGERVADDVLTEREKSVTVLESDTKKSVTVKFVKLSECAMSTIGIKGIDLGEGGSAKPTAQKAHRIEFIGDSITCGYGVDDEDESHHFKTATEDCTLAYAYKTAQLLDADYSLFSVSGYGIISGYTADGKTKIPQQTIPQYYGSLGFSYQGFKGSEMPQNIDWDFSKYQPELVVINLGTNDDSYCLGQSERMDEYSAEYVNFLKTVREKNPDAQILCTVGIMGQRIFPAIEMAVYTYKKETGDEKISSFMFDAQKPEDGLVADYHPTAVTHDKAAAALTEEIKKIMNW
ncbi:GDSL-like Lipase/Acylhydrolase family protein [Ruminococcus sp. YE71]|uniref:SGNH/GDSL hydrolase family protein n=1 Tax=unclassified Ruminococcus TaxID=2608920 RepID=UPI00088536A0|nr:MULTISPECIES: SGNH/GDSL hydrolase family protein [unclassified Ruminococcus]SDA17709.1 GDSL-like Lipase/Acylhydrolase family protein [Ruminococcus sp. YE78]SFW27223.1 GDSL-like Lipase/Acylhydrolase family protein [Ruminococcus sp. YE71]